MARNVLIRRMGYADRVTGHGFRYTMSILLHEQSYNNVWIETQLAHVDKNSIRGTYNHAQYLDGTGKCSSGMRIIWNNSKR